MVLAALLMLYNKLTEEKELEERLEPTAWSTRKDLVSSVTLTVKEHINCYSRVALAC